MTGAYVKRRIKSVLAGRKRPTVLCLGTKDVDIGIELLDNTELGDVLDRDTGHYYDESIDLVIFTEGFESLTIHQKNLIVRGALRVLKPGGVMLLCMANKKDAIPGVKKYFAALDASVSKYEETTRQLWLEIVKNV